MGTDRVVGYDPGGNGKHGVALLILEEGHIVSATTQTLDTTEEVIQYVDGLPSIIAIGVDTLTCWSSGPGGWRPADRWLREKYPGGVQSSIMTPNALAGAMGLNGMSVLLAIRAKHPEAVIVETHPKVLYFALRGKKYDYKSDKVEMERALSEHCQAIVATANEHEYDAAISAFAAASGVLGCWTNDLHTRPTDTGERLVKPCGVTNYYWPPS